MGKVHEVLNRTEMERRRSQRSGLAVNHWNEHGGQEQQGQSDVTYSSVTVLGQDLDRVSAQPTGEALARQPLPPPIRKVKIEHEHLDRNLLAFHSSDGGATEYCKLAITVIAAAKVRLFKRLLVASAHSGEGRTCVALNLACALAGAKKRVLVVDADLHNPSVFRMLGIDAHAGLAEVVGRGLPLSEAVVRVTPYDFDALPTRSRVTNPVELLSSGEFRQLLDRLDLDYDFIIFDSSPLLTTADPKLISLLTEATLLVVRPGKTRSSQMARAILPLKQEDLLGVVLNRTKE